ncbi:MAG: hypothetical protein HUJ25_16715 [Crocinitomicaceae bacterium]|nr:hypothetical protein [Crocinitomicaceae bacterium]
MKAITILIFSLICTCGFSQVFGEILSDKRPISKNIDYTINYSKPGKLIFNIAVDMDGNVTSCELDDKKSTIVTTTAMLKAKNKIMQYLKFERGYHWPEFHRGYVVIKTVQGATKEESKFAPPPF